MDIFATNDFISEEWLRSEATIQSDFLRHDHYAATLLQRLKALSPGSVVAVHGPWGRGKTDLLLRIAVPTYRKDKPSWLAPDALWVNPWQYGTADLLTPLVVSLCERIPSERRSKEPSLRKAAETILRAGCSFGFKALSVASAGGKLFELAEQPVDTLLSGLFGALDEERSSEVREKADVDPVAKMADRFRELVAAVIDAAQGSNRVLVCVDDLDRCLPHTQVAFIEALRFLVACNARATFLVGIDPNLARNSLIAHYGTDAFSAEDYLDKLLHLRFSLPAVDGKRANNLIRGLLAAPCPHDNAQTVSQFIGVDESALFSGFTAALKVQDVKIPRVIRHIVQNLYWLSVADILKGRPQTNDEIQSIVAWLATRERWPEVRVIMQDALSDPGQFISRHATLMSHLSGLDPVRESVLAELGIGAHINCRRLHIMLDAARPQQGPTEERSKWLHALENALVENGI